MTLHAFPEEVIEHLEDDP